MAESGAKWRVLRSMPMILWSFLLVSMFVSAERSLNQEGSSSSYTVDDRSESNYFHKFVDFLWQSNKSGYEHVWPELKFGWQIVVGSIIGFLGAAFGSVGGVGGGGIFVPMLSLIIGFDPKSATALSKCKRVTYLIVVVLIFFSLTEQLKWRTSSYCITKWGIMNGKDKLYLLFDLKD